MSDPHKDFNSCHDFLQTVVDGYIVAAVCSKFNVNSVAEISEEHIFPHGKPENDKDVLSAIEAIATDIELKYTIYSSSTISESTDGVLNYSRQLLSMGLLACNFIDSWKEGDGPRSMRLWKFLFLHFKEDGHSKYAIEAFRLLAKIKVTSTPKQSYELTWNRFCSTHNGKGHNKPLDLQMEQMNRVFKDDLKSFHSHINDRSVKRTANAANAVNEMMSKFDDWMQIKYDSGAHASPDKSSDVFMVTKTLLSAEALTPKAHRCHRQFPAVRKEMYSGAIANLSALQSWLLKHRDEIAKEMEYYNYKSLNS